MREILFRGKSTDNGEWVQGFVLRRPSPIQIGDHFSPWFIEKPQQDPDDSGALYNVSGETVGQYTGLNDKNGEKIFEGDIVDCWSEGVNAKGTVQQRRDGLWIIYPNWQNHIMWGLCPDEYSHTTVEVIGNVYDNPELLEGNR